MEGRGDCHDMQGRSELPACVCHTYIVLSEFLCQRLSLYLLPSARSTEHAFYILYEIDDPWAILATVLLSNHTGNPRLIAPSSKSMGFQYSPESTMNVCIPFSRRPRSMLTPDAASQPPAPPLT